MGEEGAPREENETLEEKFNRLRGEGMKDEDIIRQIFQEDLDADVSEICAITGLDNLTVGRIKGQVARWAKKQKGEEEMEPEVESEGKEVPPLDKSGMTMREYVAFYGEAGLERLKRDRLAEFLSIAPGVGKRSIAWILRQFDLDPSVRKDLNSLMSLLTSAGIKQDVSYRICSALAALEEEFRDLLVQPRPFIYPYRPQESLGYPIFPTGGRIPERQGFEFPRFQQPQYIQPPYPSYPQPYEYPQPQVRVEDIVKRAVEEVKREFQQQQVQTQQAQAQQVTTIYEPLRDADGKLVYDRDGNPVYRRIVGPVSQLGVVQEDPELRALRKWKEMKDLFKSELSEDRIRSIIREETKGKEEKGEKITKEDLIKVSQEAVQRALAQKEQEDREEERFRRLEQAIRESAVAKTVEGYQRDEYRLLGQGIQTLATREPKTIKVFIDGLERILYRSPPETKEVEPGASQGIFERISQEYVAQD